MTLTRTYGVENCLNHRVHKSGRQRNKKKETGSKEGEDHEQSVNFFTFPSSELPHSESFSV